MALSERFETQGSKPEAKVPPKRRHFAAITTAPETRPSRFSDSAQLKEPGILKGCGDRHPFRPVWVATQGLEFEFKS
jgi:hypothetical protein